MQSTQEIGKAVIDENGIICIQSPDKLNGVRYEYNSGKIVIYYPIDGSTLQLAIPQNPDDDQRPFIITEKTVTKGFTQSLFEQWDTTSLPYAPLVLLGCGVLVSVLELANNNSDALIPLVICLTLSAVIAALIVIRKNHLVERRVNIQAAFNDDFHRQAIARLDGVVNKLNEDCTKLESRLSSPQQQGTEEEREQLAQRFAEERQNIARIRDSSTNIDQRAFLAGKLIIGLIDKNADFTDIIRATQLFGSLAFYCKHRIKPLLQFDVLYDTTELMISLAQKAAKNSQYQPALKQAAILAKLLVSMGAAKLGTRNMQSFINCVRELKAMIFALEPGNFSSSDMMKALKIFSKLSGQTLEKILTVHSSEVKKVDDKKPYVKAFFGNQPKEEAAEHQAIELTSLSRPLLPVISR